MRWVDIKPQPVIPTDDRPSDVIDLPTLRGISSFEGIPSLKGIPSFETKPFYMERISAIRASLPGYDSTPPPSQASSSSSPQPTSLEAQRRERIEFFESFELPTYDLPRPDFSKELESGIKGAIASYSSAVRKALGDFSREISAGLEAARMLGEKHFREAEKTWGDLKIAAHMTLQDSLKNMFDSPVYDVIMREIDASVAISDFGFQSKRLLETLRDEVNEIRELARLMNEATDEVFKQNLRAKEKMQEAQEVLLGNLLLERISAMRYSDEISRRKLSDLAFKMRALGEAYEPAVVIDVPPPSTWETVSGIFGTAARTALGALIGAILGGPAGALTGGAIGAALGR